MNVLVTGANGLLGHHVVMELLKKQHAVHSIVRSRQHIHFDASRVTLFEGNFTEYQSLYRAAKGCEAIIHIAAVTQTDLLHPEEYNTVNVDGVAQVLKVASDLNIHRIVYISSSNTIGFGSEQQPADECFTIEYPFTDSFYAQSKVKAEQIMREASTRANQHCIIINPTFMLGDYDSKPSSGKLLIMGYKRKIMLIPGGGKNFVSVRSVAVAVCNALILGQNGERYLASGVNMSFREYYTLQQQVGGYRQLLIELPDVVLNVMGKVGDAVRRFGIRTDLCTMNLRQLMIREYYSNTKASTTLKLPQTDVKIAVKQAIDWFKKQNVI